MPAVIEVTTKFDDPNLSWKQVWSWESRVWYTIVMMIAIGTLEWVYLYQLTTTRPAITKPRADEPKDAFQPESISSAELEEQHKKSLETDSGLSVREVVKTFRVPPADSESKSADKGKHILKRAVKGVSFGIRKNEIFALLGTRYLYLSCRAFVESLKHHVLSFLILKVPMELESL